MIRTTPHRLVVKLSWINERTVSSDFGQRKKPAEVISGKKSVLRVIFLPPPPFEVPE
jgi:hypothetical protein